MMNHYVVRVFSLEHGYYTDDTYAFSLVLAKRNVLKRYRILYGNDFEFVTVKMLDSFN